jgi:hypothetical protein
MLEIGTSGTVRGEDGNILTYSAPEATAFRRWSVHFANDAAAHFEQILL